MTKFNLTLLMFIMLSTSCKEKFEFAELEVNENPIIVPSVKLNQLTNIEIEIKNSSNKILKVYGIKPSCNCTLIEDSKFEVEPKKSHKIKVAYNPNELGEHIESLTIKSNTEPPFSTITIKTTVVE